MSLMEKTCDSKGPFVVYVGQRNRIKCNYEILSKTLNNSYSSFYKSSVHITRYMIKTYSDNIVYQKTGRMCGFEVKDGFLDIRFLYCPLILMILHEIA